MRRFWNRRTSSEEPLIRIGQLSFDEVLVLDVIDAVERFCFIHLGADIEGAIGDALFDERYNDRLAEARVRLEREHDLADL